MMAYSLARVKAGRLRFEPRFPKTTPKSASPRKTGAPIRDLLHGAEGLAKEGTGDRKDVMEA